MNGEMNARLEELCKDEEYVKYILSLGSAEEISKELETKDIDLSPEEIHKIGSLLRKKANGELSDEELEQVSGGIELLGWIIGSLIACAVIAGGMFACSAAQDDC